MWLQASLVLVSLQSSFSFQARSNEADTLLKILKELEKEAGFSEKLAATYKGDDTIDVVGKESGEAVRESTCSPSQFTCDNGRCITALFLRCNQRDDCGDNSDERNCNSNTCSSWQFRCDSGQCIPASWRCDLRQNYRDQSDERNCTPATTPTKPPAPTPSPVSECSSYRILNETDRSLGYMGVVKCDRNLQKAWYRILGGAGKQMPEKCVPQQQCGTHAPGWLSGGHPTVEQGIVSRQVCFHWFSTCCYWSLNFRVRNCSGFYVYELTPTHGCFLRYCGDRKQPPTPAPVWRKYSPLTSWCTHAGRKLISRGRDDPIDAAECIRRCEAKIPGCKAVEFWEKYDYWCFECTDTSKIRRYTNTQDVSYPVYVWIKGKKINRLEGTLLRTVPPFVTAHTFCTSQDIRVCYGICPPLQQYFCAAYDYVEKADLSKGYQNPKTKLG